MRVFAAATTSEAHSLAYPSRPDLGRDVVGIPDRAFAAGAQIDGDHIWDRIFGRIGPSLVRLEQMASVLFDRQLDDAELQEVPRLVSRLSSQLGGLGFGAVAGQIRGVGDLLVSDGLGPAEAIALASAFDKARIEMARRAEEIRLSPKLGIKMVVVGDGPFEDEVLWAGSAQGLHAVLVPNAAACKDLDPDVLVLISGKSTHTETQRACEDLRLSFAELALVVVIDDDSADSAGNDGSIRNAVLNTASTVLVQKESSAEDVVIECRRSVLRSVAAPSVVVFGDGSQWLSHELAGRGFVSTTVDSLAELAESIQTNGSRSVIVTPGIGSGAENPGNRFSVVRYLRTNPQLRNVVIVVIDENPDQVRRHDALRKGADHYAGPDFDLDDLAVRVKALLSRQGDLDAGAQLSPRIAHHWERAAIAVDGLCANALRQRTILGFALVRTKDDMGEQADFDHSIASLFRSDSIVTRLDKHHLVVVVPGVSRTALIGRMTELYQHQGLAALGACVACLELPVEASTLNGALEAASALLDESELGEGAPVVGANPTQLDVRRPDVMILDQDETVGSVLVSTLQRRGLSVDYQNDGLQAIDHLRDAGPALPRVLLIDLNLKDIEGLHFLRLISKAGMLKTMRVIVLASAMDESLLRLSFDLGVDDFVLKPVSAPLLLRRIQRALGQ